MKDRKARAEDEYERWGECHGECEIKRGKVENEYERKTAG
jgi:hypothetical protein